MKKTPLQSVTERFGNKEKLIEAVKKLATSQLWLDRINDDKGLDRVSNAKLLRLHDILEDAHSRFGSRDKLIAAIQQLENRNNDDGFKRHLNQYPLPRLIDLHDASVRRIKRAAKKPKPVRKIAKKPRSKQAKAKAQSSLKG